MTELSTKAFVGIVRTNVDCFLNYVVIEWICQLANPAPTTSHQALLILATGCSHVVKKQLVTVGEPCTGLHQEWPSRPVQEDELRVE